MGVRAEMPADGKPRASEISAYFTRQFSEFHRLRFQLSSLDMEDGDDALRFGIQYTVFVGAHGHGVNW